MNHLTEEQFVMYYYGEGDGAAEVRRHLDACEACRGQYANLQRVLNIVDSAPVPERAANYGAQVWRKLEPKLDGGRGLRARWLAPVRWPVRHWAAVAAMAALVWLRLSRGVIIRPSPPVRFGGRARCASASCWWRWAIIWSARRWCWSSW